MGYYDYRAFGSPLTLPYTIARNTYAVVPYYVWQPLRPVPNYRHVELRRFYSEKELADYSGLRGASGLVTKTLKKYTWAMLSFFAGFALLPPIFMFRRVLLDRRLRFLVLCLPLWAAGMAAGVFLFPHYMAPFTAAFYALGLQAMRHLRFWKLEGKPAGLTLTRLLVTLCFAMAGLRLFAEPLHLNPARFPVGGWVCWWNGPGHFGTERAQIEKQLEQLSGPQLAIVRYAPGHEAQDEWVYNAADIDSSKVIWAREMDAANNRELFEFYKDRKVWLVQPDAQPVTVSSYSLVGQGVANPANGPSQGQSAGGLQSASRVP